MKTVTASRSQVGPSHGNSTGLGKALVVSGHPENRSKAANCSARIVLKSSHFLEVLL